MHSAELEYDYLISLLRSLLNQEKPEEKPLNVDFQLLFDCADKHGVANMAFYAIERLEKKPDPALFSEWKENCDKAFLKDIIQKMEQESIESHFHKEHIRYLVFKGRKLKELYPESDMRSMSDIDILIDAGNAFGVRTVLEHLGYTSEFFDVANDDTYMKKPVMRIECHKILFDRGWSEFYAYYQDVWNKCRQKTENAYELTPENEFIYLVCHLVKHYEMGGTGIRSIMDLWVFRKRYGVEMDWTFIESELEKLQILDKYHSCKALADRWFTISGSSQKSHDDEKVAEYIKDSGVYGNIDNRIKNDMRGNRGFFSYLAFRFFLPKEKMIILYPDLKRRPYRLPLYWILRVVSAISEKRELVYHEIKTSIKLKK